MAIAYEHLRRSQSQGTRVELVAQELVVLIVECLQQWLEERHGLVLEHAFPPGKARETPFFAPFVEEVSVVGSLQSFVMPPDVLERHLEYSGVILCGSGLLGGL